MSCWWDTVASPSAGAPCTAPRDAWGAPKYILTHDMTMWLEISPDHGVMEGVLSRSASALENRSRGLIGTICKDVTRELTTLSSWHPMTIISFFKLQNYVATYNCQHAP